MAEPNPDSFVKVSLPFLSDASLDDSEFRCLIALESWAWEKDHCWPGNAELARRCGWVKDGKPSRSKVKRILVSLEDKHVIRRVVVVSEGQHKRERIVIDRDRMGGPKIDRGGPDLNQGSLKIDHGGSNPTHPPVQDQTTLRVKNEPPPVQIQTTGGSNLNPELDPGIDPVNQTHPHQTHPAAVLIAAAPPGAGENDRVEKLFGMLDGIVKAGYCDARPLIDECARWLKANYPFHFDQHQSYSKRLWNLASGIGTPSEVIMAWRIFLKESNEHCSELVRRFGQGPKSP